MLGPFSSDGLYHSSHIVLGLLLVLLYVYVDCCVVSLDYVTVHRFQQINPQTDPDLWSYDPHEGYIVSEVAVDMSGMYLCSAVYRRNGDSVPTHETITYVVSVQRMLLNSLLFLLFYISTYLSMCV